MLSSATRALNVAASGGGASRRLRAVGLSLKSGSAEAPISAARSATRSNPKLSGRWAPARRPPGNSTRALPSEPRGSANLDSAGLMARSAQRVLATDHRLDEPVVAGLALVQHAQLLGLGVHEDEEEVTQLLHPLDGVLLEHRLY